MTVIALSTLNNAWAGRTDAVKVSDTFLVIESTTRPIASSTMHRAATVPMRTPDHQRSVMRAMYTSAERIGTTVDAANCEGCKDLKPSVQKQICFPVTYGRSH